MNKIRLIKIYELRGEIHPIEEFMIDILDKSETNDEGVIIRYRDKKNKSIYFSYLMNDIFVYTKLRNMFLEKFNCSEYEMSVIIKYLLEKHLKLAIGKVYE